MLVFPLMALLVCAQVFGDSQPTTDTVSEQEGTTGAGQRSSGSISKKRGEWGGAPLPVINPTIGNGVGFITFYAVPLQADDKISPPSIFGAAGFRTSNGSWAFGGAGKLYLKRDRFRLLVAAATARLNYNFYGIGNEVSGPESVIPITQRGGGILVGPQIRVFRRWFVGPRYYYFRVNTGLGKDGIEASVPIQEVQFALPVAALGFHLARDTRDSQYYPRSGSVVDTKLYFSSRNIGALFKYQNYEVSFQQYFRLGDRQVLAYRAKACAVNGQAPFFALCTLGNPADLRGYPTGRYTEKRMLVGQAEYRREVWWRFGVNVFAGAGQVAAAFTDFNVSNTRPGAGIGLRFVLAPKNHISLRVDYGVGQHSHAWYVMIGEAF